MQYDSHPQWGRRCAALCAAGIIATFAHCGGNGPAFTGGGNDDVPAPLVAAGLVAAAGLSQPAVPTDDALVGSFDEKDTFYANIGTGAFLPSQTHSKETLTLGMASGDFDGDGDLDAFSANIEQLGAGLVTGPAENLVFLNDGQGNFTVNQAGSGTNDSADVAVADLTGDGRPEAFVVNRDHQNIVYRNTGGGSFAQADANVATNTSESVALADFDGDGDKDAVIANAAAEQNQLYYNDGSGFFVRDVISTTMDTSTGAAAADFDQDGDMDVIVSNYGAANVFYENDGSAIFTVKQLPDLGETSSNDVAVGDLDGDGDIDAFVANTSKERDYVLENQMELYGRPNFAAAFISYERRDSGSVELGHLTGDGRLDAFVTTDSGNYVYENVPATNTATIVFNPPYAVSSGAANPGGVTLGDFQ